MMLLRSVTVLKYIIRGEPRGTLGYDVELGRVNSRGTKRAGEIPRKNNTSLSVRKRDCFALANK